jgi:D-alanine-D-alanine ligase
MSRRFELPNPESLGRVAVLMGGASAEREVSLMSGQGVLQALRERGVDAHAFDPSERPMQALLDQGFARCFIALHGRYGEDGTIQGALELLGIPYTGSGVMASSVGMDKLMTKRIWRAEGLRTPDWVQVNSAAATEQAFAVLGAPMIVKPSREGSTLGLSKVNTAQDCAAAYTKAAAMDPLVLCEQCIVGDEVTQPVLGSGESADTLPLIRVVAPNGNYDYHNKYFGEDTQYLIPSGLPPEEEQAISDLVLQAYRAIGVRGWGRVDVMIDAVTRTPYLLEVNTSPGMTGHSLVPMSAAKAGLPYPDLCLWLLAQASLDYTKAGA